MQHSTTIGTIFGTILSVLITHTFISAALVAVIGATASFFTSLYLKWLFGDKSERNKIETILKRMFGNGNNTDSK